MVALLVLSWVQAVQPPPPAPQAREAALAKQRESVENQRQSVRKQIPGSVPSDGFFTVPWTSDPPPLPAAGAGPPASSADPGDCAPVTGARLDALIREAAKREGLTPDLLRAVIDRESGFNPCAVSPKGAMGLMQLMPATAQTLGVTDPFDPRQNVDAGTRFLKQMLTRYNGDLSLALGAYNAGPGRVDATGGLPLIPETVNYVSDILDRLRQ